MKDYYFECEYCGHTWQASYFISPDSTTLRCNKCDDRNVIKRSKETSNIFGYEETVETDDDYHY